MKRRTPRQPFTITPYEPDVTFGRRLMRRVAFSTLIVALFATMGFGQNVNATLGGTVVDGTGAVLPGATVTATGIDTGVKPQRFRTSPERTSSRVSRPV